MKSAHSLLQILQDDLCSSTKLELRQTVSLVHDLLILGSDSMDWSLRKLFGLGLAGSCPLATTSHIYIDITANEVKQLFIPHQYASSYFNISVVIFFIFFRHGPNLCYNLHLKKLFTVREEVTQLILPYMM